MATGGAPEMQGVGPDDAAQPAQGVHPIPDERSDKENMENQRNLLIERMESEFGLLDKLCRSLTVIEIAEVKNKPVTTFEMNRRLLDLIFEKNKHQDLIRALTETRQMHLVNWVRGNGEYRIGFDSEWPLREKEIEILEDIQGTWIDLLDTCGLLTLLFSNEVINTRQMAFIESKPTTYEKNEELLNILRRCSLTAYFTTIVCLRASNQDHIADVLEGKGAVVQVHANLDGERLAEKETQIVREIANLLLQNVPENRINLLLQEVPIKIIAAKRGSSIVLYIYCKTLDELTYLCEVINNEELKDRIENLFNTLLHDMVTRVIDLYVVETEINKAKKCFEREASRDQLDEDISRLRARMQCLLLEQKKQPIVGSEEEKSESSPRGPNTLAPALSRAYTRPAQTTRPAHRMNPSRIGTSEEEPMKVEGNVSPTRGAPVQGAGFTMFAPNENKRQANQRLADEEKRKHEEYKKANRPHYSYVGTVGGDSSAETREIDVTQRRLPPTGSNLTPQQKTQMYKEQEKKRIEKEEEEYKQKQRQKSIENKKREEQRRKELEAARRRTNAAWLDKMEGKSSEKTTEKPAAAAASAASSSAASASATSASATSASATCASATGGNTEEIDNCEFVSALEQLESMFPWVDKDILKSLLKEAGNDVDHVAQLLSQ